MLWAITSYFNPAGYRTRLENYRRFRAHLTVPLVAVEASFDGRFELGPQDAEILVQRRARDVLWQKERLLNVALGFLPSECDRVAWLDCDVVFAADDWPQRASAALTTHSLVQLFSERCDPDRETTADPSKWREADSATPGVATKIATGGVAPEDLSDPLAAVSGLAWAARRESLDGLGLYDACVLGGGDRVILCAALGEFDHISATHMSPQHTQHYRAWAASFADAMGGRIGYIDGRILHLWHGDLRDRRYRERTGRLKHYGFDPRTDLALGPEGCWRWNTPKTDMHRYVRSYFNSRNEDGAQVKSSERS
jgi:hypothetical protein